MEEASIKGIGSGEGVATDAPMAMLSTLLSNPEAMQRLRGMLEGMVGSGKSSVEKSDTDAPTDSKAVNMDGLSAVLSNHEILARLPQMMAAFKPLIDAKGDAHTEAKKPSSPSQNREHLLLALKPFLSKERCDAVDTILRISQLGEVLGRMK